MNNDTKKGGIMSRTTGEWTVRGGVDEFFIDAPGVVCLAVVNKCVNAPERAKEAKANASYICQAVNGHADLTDALKAALTDEAEVGRSRGYPVWRQDDVGTLS